MELQVEKQHSKKNTQQKKKQYFAILCSFNQILTTCNETVIVVRIGNNYVEGNYKITCPYLEVCCVIMYWEHQENILDLSTISYISL